MEKIKIICSIFLINILCGVAGAEILIIAHPDVPVDAVSQREIREMFMGKHVKWGDNSAIKAAILDAKETHRAFLAQHVKRTDSQWKRYWKKMVFTGRALPPKSFASQEDMVNFVSKTPGAIGYVEADTPPASVKQLSVKD